MRNKTTPEGIRERHTEDCLCDLKLKQPHCRNHSTPLAGPHWELHLLLDALAASEHESSMLDHLLEQMSDQVKKAMRCAEDGIAQRDAAERERDEALTERADLEIGLTLCQDDLTKCGTGLAAARSALEKYGRHHGACPSRPITLTGDWWLDPPEMGACTCGFSVATVGSAPDAG